MWASRLVDEGEIGVELGGAGQEVAAAGDEALLPGVEEGTQCVRTAAGSEGVDELGDITKRIAAPP